MTESAEKTSAGKRVLVVENDNLSATILSLLLEELGHDVRTVTDGEAAVVAGREFRPDVLLCDLRLEGSVDGFDVARRFADDPDLSGVARFVVSALDRREVHELDRDGRFEAVLTKPAGADELQELIEGAGDGGAGPEERGA